MILGTEQIDNEAQGANTLKEEFLDLKTVTILKDKIIDTLNIFLNLSVIGQHSGKVLDPCSLGHRFKSLGNI